MATSAIIERGMVRLSASVATREDVRKDALQSNQISVSEKEAKGG